VINVPNRTDVHMRLRTVKSLLRHDSRPYLPVIRAMTSSLTS
jgi:hypothetical protein